MSASDRNPTDLTWTAPTVAAGFKGEVRGGSLASQIARAVAIALKRSKKDRADIANEMSAYLGERVSLAMLNAYASEARTTHRITVERFMALVEVTGCLDLLGLVAEPFGQAVVASRYAAIIELHLIEEHQRELDARKAELLAVARSRP
ncbi:MAG: hypothetical protein WDM94_09405 [Bauldia sp.]